MSLISYSCKVNMEEKRKAKNFTTFENLVVDLAKNQAWNAIAAAYNGSCQTGHRTPKQLKEVNGVLKRTARKNVASDRAEHFKSGSGTYTKTTSNIDTKIIEALPQQFQPDANLFDSSAPLFRDIQDSSGFESQHPKELIVPEPIRLIIPESICSPIISCPSPTTNSTHNFNSFVSQKRKHPVESLTEIIDKQKKLKYNLYEAEMKEKTKLIQEEREYKKQKHEMDMKIIQEESECKKEKQEMDKKLLNMQLEEQSLKLENQKIQIQILNVRIGKKEIVYSSTSVEWWPFYASRRLYFLYDYMKTNIQDLNLSSCIETY
ncbi:hypothetical protein FQR65_LT15048 [Abscondita terminalis]|nr:hypothetical protein FQR65_LT15048 [Abscondita terminalis]